MTFRSGIVAALLLGLTFMAGALDAHAGDPVEDARVREAGNLLERIAAFQAEKKKADLEKAFAKLPKIHNELRTGAVRARLQQALGGVMADEALGATRSAAADTLGRLNDPKGAWKQLGPFLPSTRLKAAGPFPLRVLQAVGVLACDASIASLLKLMEKAKDANVSRFAIQALGKYGWSKRRVAVLRDLADFLKRLRPGGARPGSGRGGGRAARERYNFLQLSLVSALNELTGQKIESADLWLAAYKEHKKSPAKLFTFEK